MSSVHNIYFIEQINMSGSLIPPLPYFVTEGGRNDKALGYFLTEDEAQTFIDNQ